MAVGVTLLHSFWTTSKALPKTFSSWTQRVLFLDKEIHFLDSCILSIPNPLHHPTISISPRSLVLHYHWGASTLNNTHAYCCLSTFKTPGFCPYLQRKKSTLEKVKNLGSILHHPPPTPSKKNSLFLYLEEFYIVVVDAGGSFHKYACAIGEYTPKMPSRLIYPHGTWRKLYTFADTHAQKTYGSLNKSNSLLYLCGRWQWIRFQIRMSIIETKAAVFFKEIQPTFGGGGWWDTTSEDVFSYKDLNF